MPALADLQRAFVGALYEGATPDGVRAGRVPASERFATYVHAANANWREALAGTYPVVARLVGPAFFAEVARRYARAHPSASGDLHEFGAQLAEFLAGYPPAADLAYLPDVARLEWAWHRSFHAADAAPLDRRALGAVRPEAQGAIRLRLHPSVRLLRSAHPVASIWEANQEGRDGTPDRSRGPEWILVQRDGVEVAVHRLRAPEWRFLEAIAGGADLDAASECLGDDTEALLGPLLARMAAAGVFAGFTA